MGIPAGISGIQEWLKFAHFCIHEIKLTKGQIFQVQIPGTYPVIASSWANFSQCMCKSFACFFDGQKNQDTIFSWKTFLNWNISCNEVQMWKPLSIWYWQYMWYILFPSISYYFHIPKIFLNFFPHTGKNRNRRKSNLLP